MVYDRLVALQNWFFPQQCLLCHEQVATTAALCRPCAAALPLLGHSCERCGASLPAIPAAGPAHCGRCLTRAPSYDRTRSLYQYLPPVDRLVQGFKYHRRLDWGRVLGEALARHLEATSERADAIVPVPLHRRRLRDRGYNQSLELARPIGRTLGIPVRPRAARRVRPTQAQAGLSRDERRRNVRNAFDIVETVTGQRIAIVDDVMTSGHTVDALARALKRAGADEVVVWVLARA